MDTDEGGLIFSLRLQTLEYSCMKTLPHLFFPHFIAITRPSLKFYKQFLLIITIAQEIKQLFNFSLEEKRYSLQTAFCD